MHPAALTKTFKGQYPRNIIANKSTSIVLDEYILKTCLNILKLVGIEKLEQVKVTKESPWEELLPRRLSPGPALE